MGKITVSSNLSNLGSVEEIRRFLSAWVEQATRQVNGNLTFYQNVRSSPLTVVAFANASDPQTVPHQLGRVPDGFLVIKQTAPASIYAPAGASYAWTSSAIYLQSDAGVTASIYIL